MPEGNLVERFLSGFEPVRVEGCPDLLFLHHFASGQLSAEEIRHFTPHADTCLYCQHEIVELRKLLHFERHGHWIPYWIDKAGRAVRLHWAVTLWAAAQSWFAWGHSHTHVPLRRGIGRGWAVAAAAILILLVAGRVTVLPALAQSPSVLAAAKQVPVIRWLLPASMREYLEATLLQDQLSEIRGAELTRYTAVAHQAEVHLKRAIALDPRYANAYQALGSLYENWYFWDPAAPNSVRLLRQAKAMYQQALQLRPGLLDARRGLGDVYAATGEYTKEERQYDAILADDPNDSDTLSWRGWVRLERGDYQGAIADFTASLRRDPRDFDTLTALAMAYAASGDTPAVERTYRQLEQVNPGRAKLLRQLVRPARQNR